jgi:hypothetical protein
MKKSIEELLTTIAENHLKVLIVDDNSINVRLFKTGDPQSKDWSSGEISELLGARVFMPLIGVVKIFNDQFPEGFADALKVFQEMSPADIHSPMFDPANYAGRFRWSVDHNQPTHKITP